MKGFVNVFILSTLLSHLALGQEAKFNRINVVDYKLKITESMVLKLHRGLTNIIYPKIEGKRKRASAASHVSIKVTKGNSRVKSAKVGNRQGRITFHKHSTCQANLYASTDASSEGSIVLNYYFNYDVSEMKEASECIHQALTKLDDQTDKDLALNLELISPIPSEQNNRLKTDLIKKKPEVK